MGNWAFFLAVHIFISGSYVSNEGTSYRHAQPQRPSVAQSVESQLAGQAALLRIEKKSQHNQTQSSIVKAAKAQGSTFQRTFLFSCCHLDWV